MSKFDKINKAIEVLNNAENRFTIVDMDADLREAIETAVSVMKEQTAMRFHNMDFILDEDMLFEEGTLESGYAWATDKLVDLTNYKEKMQSFLKAEGEEYDENEHYDGCEINFYPYYDRETEEVWIMASYSIFDEHYFEERIDLTDKEAKLVRKDFIEYYHDEEYEEILADLQAEQNFDDIGRE